MKTKIDKMAGLSRWKYQEKTLQAEHLCYKKWANVSRYVNKKTFATAGICSYLPKDIVYVYHMKTCNKGVYTRTHIYRLLKTWRGGGNMEYNITNFVHWQFHKNYVHFHVLYRSMLHI